MLESLLPYDPRLQERSVLAVLIRDLTRFSLVKIDRGTNTIEVHRLVQAVIRAQMATKEEHEEAMHEVLASWSAPGRGRAAPTTRRTGRGTTSSGRI